MGGDRLTDHPTLQLLDLAREGDRGAREELYGRHLARLQRWARGRLPANARSYLDTDDVVQKVLADSLRHVDAFDPRHSGAFLAYLRKGVIHSIRDEVRRLGRRPTQFETASGVADERHSPLQAAIGEESLERYEQGLARLSEHEREAVVARLELGLSYQEIATELGKNSPDAARMLVTRAVYRLAEWMQESSDGPE